MPGPAHDLPPDLAALFAAAIPATPSTLSSGGSSNALSQSLAAMFTIDA